MTDPLPQTLDIQQILQRLPHRYPFLLVDRVVAWTAGEKIKAIKNVSMNEPHFQGHFPEFPIMPGVLILEAMAQVGGVLAFLSEPDTTDDKLVFFMGIDGAKFRRPVTPGDQLVIHMTVIKHRGKIWRFKGEAFVDGQLATEAELMATITDK